MVDGDHVDAVLYVGVRVELDAAFEVTGQEVVCVCYWVLVSMAYS